ncbi:MAG: cytochrome c oxidase accessory protein CcoG [Isosphaera sp.]|nr:cytochrome c oxidase accessory protein CcoG [Isosphaera sp.]
MTNATVQGVTIGASGSPPRVLATMNQDGSRRWIDPRPSYGRYWRRRRVVAYSLIALFTALPWVRISGEPALLLDWGARRFTVLGRTFLPTDTLLLALLFLIVFVTVFLVTAVFGRAWCGWGCPQTVYMEFVFRPIERLLSGRRGRGAGGGAVGVGVGGGGFVGSSAARALKLVIFAGISFVLANTFLAYFVGTDRLVEWVVRSPASHPWEFALVLAVTGAMLFDFGYFREQTCMVACPYGRFQSVLLDQSSMIVAYDEARGEPRGRGRGLRRGGGCGASGCGVGSGQCAGSGHGAEPVHGAACAVAGSPAAEQLGGRLGALLGDANGRGASAGDAPAALGDCVDCTMCVQVCPTGIDIRNGLQMECVHCTQCIDACDAVMARVGRPPGLIRYSSQRALRGGPATLVSARVLAYGVVLAALVAGFLLALSTRGGADLMVLRTRGAPFVIPGPGLVGNTVQVRLTNRSGERARFTLRASGTPGAALRGAEEPVTLEPGERRTLSGMIVVPDGALEAGRSSVTVEVLDQAGRVLRSRRAAVVGPVASAAQTPPASTGAKP